MQIADEPHPTAHSHPFLIHLIPPRPHIFGHAGRPRASPPSDLVKTRSQPPIPHPRPSSSAPRPKPSQATPQASQVHTTPHLTLHDASHGRPPPHLHHPLPRRCRGRVPLRLRRAPRRLRRLRRRARPPLPLPGPAQPPPRRPCQAQSRRRQRRVGQLRVRALRGVLGERHPRGDRVGPGEAGEDLLRARHRGVLRQPDGTARGEDGAHRRDRQVRGAAAARRQLPQRGRGQPARRAGAGDRAGVRDRLQRAHRHRAGHRHLRRAARVGGPRADRGAREDDHRRRQRPDQDPNRPGAHRRVHRAVRERQLQLHRHERPQADRRDRLGVRDALRCPLIGFYSTPFAMMLSNYCHKDMPECWPSSEPSTCDGGGLTTCGWTFFSANKKVTKYIIFFFPRRTHCNFLFFFSVEDLVICSEYSTIASLLFQVSGDEICCM